MIVTTEEQLERLRVAGRAVAATREAMLRAVAPGITTRELDQIAERILNEHQAISAPRSIYHFPGTTCISVNGCVAHGIPDDRVLQKGDVVNVDVSASVEGYFADTGATMVVGYAPEAHRQRSAGQQKVTEEQIEERTKAAFSVIACAEEALRAVIEVIRAGDGLNQIGHKIMNVAKKQGFRVIRNLTGHGIGTSLHEDPHHVYNYYVKNERRILQKGMVLAIEPFISNDEEVVHEATDGWGLHVMRPSTIVAQFEHTVMITEHRAVVLTL